MGFFNYHVLGREEALVTPAAVTQHNEQQVEKAAARRARTSLLEATSSSNLLQQQQRPAYGDSGVPSNSSSGGTRMHSVDGNEGGNWSKVSLNPQQESKRNDLFRSPPSYESLEATDSAFRAKMTSVTVASQESKRVVPSWLQPQPQLQVINAPPREIVEVPARRGPQEAGPSQRRPFEAQRNNNPARSASPSPRSELLDLT